MNWPKNDEAPALAGGGASGATAEDGNLKGDSTQNRDVKGTGAVQDDWTHFDLVLGLTEDLLPVVSNPKATVSPRSNIKDVGKVPSLYNGDRQVHGFSDWTRHVTTGAEIVKWSRERDFGICIQTRHVRALDVDIPDAVESQAVREFIARRFALPTRSRGNSSKFLVAFEMDGPFTKRRFKTAQGVIEFLATGQQFIAVGRHPSGARYEWEGGLPGAFPEVTVVEFEALWSALVEEFGTEESVERPASVKQAKLDAVHENDPVARHLHDAGMVKRVERDGRLHITCPWESEHTSDTGDSSTTYWPAHTGGFEHGGFRCLHAHCEERNVEDMKEALGIAEDTTDDFEVLGGEAQGDRFGLKGFTASDLLSMEFNPIKWVIPGILPEGVFLLIASPKIGKSWLALQMVLAVGTGSEVLGRQATRGAALYLALEDNPRRLQGRLKELDADMLLTDAQGTALEFHTEWPRVDQGGARAIEEWLVMHPDAKLVVIDVLERFRPARKAKGNLYAEDYDALKALKAVAEAHRVTVVVVHHTRKNASDDPMAMVSGTQGLTGSADGMLLLERARGEARGSLHVIGRDVEGEGEFVVEFSDCRWSMVGAAKAVASTLERQEILNALNDAAGALTAAELADAVGKKRTTVARLLSKMVNEGTVTHNGPRYSPAHSLLAVFDAQEGRDVTGRG